MSENADREPTEVRSSAKGVWSAAMKPRKELHIQDGFLFECLKEGRRVSLVLRSGRTISGRIKRFDRFVVLIENGTQEILVYKQPITGLGAAGR